MLWTLIAWILIASIVTAALYAWDKRSAVAGRPRIAERTLLIWSAVGGWPGGWIAGRRLRHKTKKVSYRVQFAFCVMLNIGVVATLLWMKG